MSQDQIYRKALGDVFQCCVNVQLDKRLAELPVNRMQNSVERENEGPQRLDQYLDVLIPEKIPSAGLAKPYPERWEDTLSAFPNGNVGLPWNTLCKNMKKALHTLHIDGGNLRQLISFFIIVVRYQWTSFPKRLYIDFHKIDPQTWGRIRWEEIKYIKDYAEEKNVPFAFPSIDGNPVFENVSRRAATEMLGAVITLFFSLKIFPDVEEFACDKKIFQMIENYVREPLKKAPLLAIRGLDRSDPIPWNVVRRLANVTPTKHLLLEGWLSDLPEQEGEGLRDYSDITFNKINLGRTLIKYLIDFSVAKLSALRYIGEDCTKKGREWKDPLQFVFDLSSQGECLETLCIGLSRPSIGYMSGPRLPHMGMLKKLTHLWIDSDSTVQRWQALDIMEFFWRLDPQPNDTSPLFGNPPNLVDLRVIGHPDDVRRWVDHVRGYVLDPDSKVWETLKKIGIRDATRLERYNKDLAGKIDFYLIGEDEDIKLWRIGGHTRRRQFWEVVIEE